MTPLSELLDILTLEEIDRDLYRVQNPGRPRSLYGGQVAAQALRAASATVGDDRFANSAHGYFLRLGKPGRPTILQVHRDRDGRSYSHRRVEAIQDGEVIFSLACSFHVPEAGAFEVEVDAQREAATFEDSVPAAYGQGDPEHHDAFEFRVYPMAAHPDAPEGFHRAPARIWIKPRGPVTDDAALHSSLVMFISDMFSGFNEVDVPGQPFGGGPTLDHSVWFHRPVRVDQWLLLNLRPLIATGGRGVYQGGLFTRDGSRLCSLSQEIVVRPAPSHQLQGSIDSWARFANVLAQRARHG
ncbi:MAG: thioesterase family protein [Actinomycetota bacterium]|nr:thioesterase family protein [Actinomycetota bacterium]